MTKLSNNFTLEELTYSLTAERHGMTNMPEREELKHLSFLAKHYLQPLRDKFGVIKVNSAYRSKELNKLVGGASDSWHIKGCAADIKVPSMLVAAQMITFLHQRFVNEGVGYDEIILSVRKKTNSVWLHIAYSPVSYNNRLRTNIIIY